MTRPAILMANLKTGLLEVPGKDWVVLKLGHVGIIRLVEVDTNHFKGNFPDSCMMYGTQYYSDNAEDDLLKDRGIEWKVVLPRVKLKAHTQHYFSVVEGNVNLLSAGINYVKLENVPRWRNQPSSLDRQQERCCSSPIITCSG